MLDPGTAVAEDQPFLAPVQSTDDRCGVGQRAHEVDLDIGLIPLARRGLDHRPRPVGPGGQPFQHLCGVSDRRREPDPLEVSAREPPDASQDREEVPAPVVACERVKLVDDDGPNGSEEVPVVDLAGHEDDFERFRRGQQAIGGIGEDAPPLRLGRIAVPAGRSPADQPEVPFQPLLLIVQEGTDRADVEHAQAGPGARQHPGQDREERRLGLAACGRRQDDQVRPVEETLDGEVLDGSEIPPSQRVDDVMLERRMQPIEGIHRVSSMSSTPVAWASRSVAVISLGFMVNR